MQAYAKKSEKITGYQIFILIREMLKIKVPDLQEHRSVTDNLNLN